ncbi:uncharacterized protein K444DRAFT_148145 [Hyaloscypha bicolor E]|uniref:Uncharacterized protein n=1 Tax=Hyaloscypha bicolor E TaxID=1095630 RepID=A0A2J6SRQ9_9HELO|nr:uncharacterized protein K444DRAFT_148145 [Hyaloscypha bicolor E]PMD53475.1 hypothetical protein K444DRAFT_148145 [Hyaloscypha bicolor E]
MEPRAQRPKQTPMASIHVLSQSLQHNPKFVSYRVAFLPPKLQVNTVSRALIPVIGLITLFATCAPSAFVVLRWINRRKKRSQEFSMIEDSSICISSSWCSRTDTNIPTNERPLGRGTVAYACPPVHGDIEMRPRAGADFLWDHEALFVSYESRFCVTNSIQSKSACMRT